MAVDVAADGHHQFFWIAKDAVPQPALGQITEETFAPVEPGSAAG
jgi:hypothetical protein